MTVIALRSLVFPCQYYSFNGLYSYVIHLGSPLCNLSSDCIIKHSFVSPSLPHTVTFFAAYLHSIQVPLYYFLLVSVVIRLCARRPRNEGSISSRCKTFCLLQSIESSCEAHPASCSVGIRGSIPGHVVAGV